MAKIMLITILILFCTGSVVKAQNEVVPFDPVLSPFLNVRDFCIADDGQEAFFTIQSPDQAISQIACTRKVNGEWSAPSLLPFCDTYMYLEPFLTADGKRLFFASDRPLDGSAVRKDFDIWYVERKNNNAPWSAPVNLGEPVNSGLDQFYPTLSDNLNLYFTMASPEGLGKDDIYFSRWDGRQYTTPVLLDTNVNSSGYEFNAFISRNEDFILFTKYNEPGGQGSGDLYIAQKDAYGNWQKAVNLGVPVNTKAMEYCPFYDEKNHTLYFTSRRNTLQPRPFRDINDFQEYINNGENGLSKIYKVSFKIR